jgi:hypothetical protein
VPNTEKVNSLDFLKNFLKSFHKNCRTDTYPQNTDILPNHERDFSIPISFKREQVKISRRNYEVPGRRKTNQLKILRKPVVLAASNISRKRYLKHTQDDERINFSQLARSGHKIFG